MSYVCSTCIGERWLARHISENADQNECDFCERTSDEAFAVDLGDIIDHIRERIECIYEDPANRVGFDSSEGGYQLSTMDTYEILDEVGLGVESDALREELVDGVGRSEWVHKNPYSLSEEDALQLSWETFAKTVKHRVRYLMFPAEPHDEYHVREGLELSEVLDALGDAFVRYNLVSTLKASTRLFRMRLHAPDDAPKNTLEALGPPPVESARFSNRMSPAGLSMFYAALDEVTARAETFVRYDGRPAAATMATFELAEDVTVLNLTALPEYPSVFGSDEANLERPTVHFLHSFVHDLVQPVEKDGREHVEYVPSQVVTEYIRFRLSEKAGRPVRGILYPSTRHENGVGCVLFVAHEDITGVLPDRAPFRLLAKMTRTFPVDTRREARPRRRNKPSAGGE